MCALLDSNGSDFPMFTKTQLTASALLTQTAWTVSSLLAARVYRVMAQNCQMINGAIMPSKQRQRHVVENRRPEDPQMRH